LPRSIQQTYRYLVQVLPALVVAPRYFSGAVELGTVTQSFGSFSHVFSDFSLVVNRFDALSQLGAQIGRIQELCDAVEVKVAREDRIFFGKNPGDTDSLEKLAKSEIAIREIPDGGLALHNVSVSTPSLENQRELVRNITLRIEPGGRLLIAGVSGCGKSSLVRAIAGLWKNGTGVITRPAGGIFFLPQRPFMTLGSLAQNLVYPKSIEDPDAASDEDLRRILDIVDLHELPARMGGLKTICDWGDTLSLGEQQRLSFARLLLAKPQLAIIDEGSSALDLAGEQRMYERLRELNITCVSIGHRPSLLKYHDTILRLGIKSSVEDVNSWSIERITEAVREQAVVQAL
jgi:vitamin B12/bleomycin/antimicrobial peptide transport system ATP-binding/permease protein